MPAVPVVEEAPLLAVEPVVAAEPVSEAVDAVAVAPVSAAASRSLTKVTGMKTMSVPLRLVEVAVVMRAVSVVASEAVKSRSESTR